MIVFNDLYLSCAIASCYEGDTGATTTGEGGTTTNDAGVTAGGTTTNNTNDANKTFTQEQLNKILADDRRKHQSALQKTEQTYKDLLANNQNLSAQERKTLEDSLATVQGQLRTKEQQAALERKELEERFSNKLNESDGRAKEWENRYREETVNRSIQDAAVKGDAFRAEQVVTLLRSMSKLVEIVDPKTQKGTGRFECVIEFPDKDATTGDPIVTTRTPEDAIKRMKELPETYGNLFKSNVVSGIGANSSAAGITGSNGRIDVRNLTPAQYREIRSKNPELLGLRSHRRR